MVLIPRLGMADEWHGLVGGSEGREWRMWMSSERTYMGLQELDGS